MNINLKLLERAHERAGHHLACVLDIYDYQPVHTTSGLWYKCKKCGKEKPRS